MASESAPEDHSRGHLLGGAAAVPPSKCPREWSSGALSGAAIAAAVPPLLQQQPAASISQHQPAAASSSQQQPAGLSRALTGSHAALADGVCWD